MDTQQKFLSFNLGTKDTAVISLRNITEILPVSLAEVCAVPQMPSCVIGIYSWRGEMLWLVDLEEMLGYPPLLQGSNFPSKIMAIVLEAEGKCLGLLVRQLIDIENLEPQQMKQPSTELFYPAMTPFLQGYFINSAQEVVFNLDASAVLQAPMWKVYH